MKGLFWWCLVYTKCISLFFLLSGFPNSVSDMFRRKSIHSYGEWHQNKCFIVMSIPWEITIFHAPVFQTKEKYGKECKVCIKLILWNYFFKRIMQFSINLYWKSLLLNVLHLTFFPTSSDLCTPLHCVPMVSRHSHALQKDRGLSDL